jgi:dTDP-4-dehydrorhamnose reductase
MKKVLITGASGMFGTAMEGVCRDNLVDVVGTSSKDFDIANKDTLEKAIEECSPGIIINSAVFMGIPACEENPKRAFDVNAVAALELARICRRRGITLVQISTNAIFDGKKGDLYFETDVPNPQNIYGLSKYAGEIGVRNSLAESYIVRFPKLFGGRRNNTSGFTDKMIAKMKAGEELKISGDRVDPFTYTVHAARKLISLLENQAPFGIYHIANQGSVSYYDFICAFAEKVGYSGKIIRAKDRDITQPTLNPLRNELGSLKIKDMPSWEDALNEYVKVERVKI